MDLQVRHVYERLAPDANEAIIADLTETVELQAVEIEKLGLELDRANAWIRELAAELERRAVEQEPEPLTFRERILAAVAAGS
jgi:hypothetical protein